MAKYKAKIQQLRKRLWKVAKAEAEAAISVTLILGHVKRLPPDYVGERHTVMTKRIEISDGEAWEGDGWAEFEERPGPEPKHDSAPLDPPPFPTPKNVVMYAVFVKPYPGPGDEERQRSADEVDAQNYDQATAEWDGAKWREPNLGKAPESRENEVEDK